LKNAVKEKNKMEIHPPTTPNEHKCKHKHTRILKIEKCRRKQQKSPLKTTSKSQHKNNNKHVAKHKVRWKKHIWSSVNIKKMNIYTQYVFPQTLKRFESLLDEIQYPKTMI
jgi:hypothetical protein